MSKRQPVSAKDVASYIIKLSQDVGEPLTNMKLQKLLYYSYVWYLVEKNKMKKLFNDPIVAWKYGPVVPAVYDIYKKYGADFIKEPTGGNIENLDEEAKNIIEDVFEIYGSKNGIELTNITHSETPWLESYKDGSEKEIIPDDLIFAYYKAKRDRTSTTAPSNDE